MIILGIDPGVATVGVGIIQNVGSQFAVLGCGAILTPKEHALPQRLQQIYSETIEVIEKYKPDCMAIEELFFNQNITTGIAVAQGRGVSLLAAVNAGVPIYEYTPLQVKQSVTGYGRASKAQVQHMMKTLLKLNVIPQPDDAADALAIALCHANSYKYNEMVGRN